MLLTRRFSQVHAERAEIVMRKGAQKTVSNVFDVTAVK